MTKGGEVLNTLRAGDQFGEMALLDGFPRVASLKAAEDTECLVMARWDFAAGLRTNPRIALAMLPVMSKRIRELEEPREEELMAVREQVEREVELSTRR